jgi:hypothetical protein
VHQVIWKKRPGNLSKKVILLHDNACPQTANLTKGTVGKEIMNHPPFNPDLAPSDIHLFEPIKVQLGGQKFQTDDELDHGVLYWPLKSKPFMLLALITDQDYGKNVRVKGECLAKECLMQKSPDQP